MTAGSRASPQVNIVASIAAELGIPCRVHTPTGQASPEVLSAIAKGAERIAHKAGYNNVIIARAREDAAALGWRDIPFGMECPEAIEETAGQVVNLPFGAGDGAPERLVMPVGSGMSLAGVLWGLKRVWPGKAPPVLGIVVGADPTKRLDKYAPPGWRQMVELRPSGLDYHDEAPRNRLGPLVLDPIYEAKCLPFLRAGDLFWIVGVRETVGR